MKEVCVITSRAGTKNKGLWRLREVPIVRWSLDIASHYAAPIVVTTDQLEVMRMAEDYGVPLVVRPAELASGTRHLDAVLHAVEGLGLDEMDIVHLIQPTSPFLRIHDLCTAARLIEGHSFQTVIPVPHNFHEYNQRTLPPVLFVHPEERAECFVAQSKPPRYAYGNLVSTRYGALRRDGFFASPSVPSIIPAPYGLDVNEPDDIAIAEAYLSAGLVRVEEMR